ncbi:hypothetical protein SAMN04490243_2093 [Robiginitalea myxolifaciens]|uniref:Uncharacterized protein n=1 Tax=Robiginitalea myxolifaciens TaxID=400055 RepID=A0A1I6H1Y3_9FLAO|nr:hypothetical protein [Robiginitalea myxolifaciens]SFR48428.1 hypothetical protein SAMN04490243_2093 [Robiginitalea myxolifaciens]
MKVALILPNNPSNAPYLNYYLEVIRKTGADYSLYYWDRTGKEAGKQVFSRIPKHRYPWNKFIDYLRFAKFIKRSLKAGNYTRVVVFTPQLAIFLQKFLTGSYRGEFMLDIRDFSVMMNHFPGRFKRCYQGADHIVISSPGFKEWLPPHKSLITGHNVGAELVQENMSRTGKDYPSPEKWPLVLTTIGQIKDYDSDHRFVAELCNNEAIQMNFIGSGPTLQALKDFAESRDCSNISFYGQYNKPDEEALLADTDFLNILISRTEFNKGASLLSNRLYLSALYRIPCLVNSETAQSELVAKYGLGIVIDQYCEVPEKIENFVRDFDASVFNTNCEVFLKDISGDIDHFQSAFADFLRSQP